MPLARVAREHGLELRFIEFMPLDGDGGGTPTRSSPARKSSRSSPTPSARWSRSGATDRRAPATEYRFADGGPPIGVIRSVTRAVLRPLRPAAADRRRPSAKLPLLDRGVGRPGPAASRRHRRATGRADPRSRSRPRRQKPRHRRRPLRPGPIDRCTRLAADAPNPPIRTTDDSPWTTSLGTTKDSDSSAPAAAIAAPVRRATSGSTRPRSRPWPRRSAWMSAEFEETYVRQVGIRKSLVEFPNGDCVFFDTDLARLPGLRRRPRQCRTWPFWASNLRSRRRLGRNLPGLPGQRPGPLVTREEIEPSCGVISRPWQTV